MPRDLRAARYRAENATVMGTQILERDENVTTFKGTISGDESSQVRLTIDGDNVEGFFMTGGEKFFVEPALNYSALAAKEDLIVYRPEDALHNETFACHSELAEKIEKGKELVAAQSITTDLRVIEIATEADFEYVNSVGGANAANSKILGILNMVEGVYQNELGLTVSVVFQHTWSAQDPFNGTNSDALLRSFQGYWNANFPRTGIERDAAHLFTAKPGVMAQGYAYINVVCRPVTETSPDVAYGLSGRVNIEWNWEAANFLITAHEIGHNLGASHSDGAQSCTNSLMNAQLSGSSQLSFCSSSRTEISNYLAANGTCLAPRMSKSVKLDFDGDAKGDIAVFRPSNGYWYLNQSGRGFNFAQFGQSGDKPTAADYDGDGKTDISVYRGGNWYRLNSATNTFEGVSFGAAADIPVPADFDGDGKTDVAVFRPLIGSWFWLNSGSGNSFASVQFGQSGDVPTPADYDGDGKADVNVFRPSNGYWYRTNSSSRAFAAAQFGQNGDKALSGDFDGDGKTDLVVFRPSSGYWYILRSTDNRISGTQFGASSDVPMPADFDGDGKTDISVFRQASGYWYRVNSSSNGFVGVQFGQNGDVPAEFNQ